MSPGTDIYGNMTTPTDTSYEYKKRFMWIPSRMYNGKMVWLKTVLEKHKVQTTKDSANHAYVYYNSCGLYTEEDAFLEAI